MHNQRFPRHTFYSSFITLKYSILVIFLTCIEKYWDGLLNSSGFGFRTKGYMERSHGARDSRTQLELNMWRVTSWWRSGASAVECSLVALYPDMHSMDWLSATSNLFWFITELLLQRLYKVLLTLTKQWSWLRWSSSSFQRTCNNITNWPLIIITKSHLYAIRFVLINIRFIEAASMDNWLGKNKTKLKLLSIFNLFNTFYY